MGCAPNQDFQFPCNMCVINSLFTSIPFKQKTHKTHTVRYYCRKKFNVQIYALSGITWVTVAKNAPPKREPFAAHSGKTSPPPPHHYHPLPPAVPPPRHLCGRLLLHHWTDTWICGEALYKGVELSSYTCSSSWSCCCASCNGLILMSAFF